MIFKVPSNLPATDRVANHYIWLPQGPIQPGLEPQGCPRDEASTAALGNLCQYLISLWVKNFQLTSLLF